MIYEVVFDKSARKEWKQLDTTIQRQFSKKLKERAKHPHVRSAKLSGMPNCYKIKLKKLGYRLVYEVNDHRIIITVIAIGQRTRALVYDIAQNRLQQDLVTISD